MTYNSTQNEKCYFPPMLSNGDISLAPDAEGMLGYTQEAYQKSDMHAFDGMVVRCARRTAIATSVRARLFPFGKFIFGQGSALENWSQSLDIENGFFESDCKYADGTGIRSKGFIHPDLNIYALRKSFETDGTKRVYFDVTLEGYDTNIDKYMSVTCVKNTGKYCSIGFKMYGMDVFCGEIRFFVDKPFDTEIREHGARMSFEVSGGESVCFYYFLEDDLEGADYSQNLDKICKRIESLGFFGLLKETESHFNGFFGNGYVKSSDKRLESIYKTSLYCVKCNTTKYSVAVGLNNGSWDGRYFAFDEYTSFLGLIGAQKTELARRVPTFRMGSSLASAVRRASESSKDLNGRMARYHWESAENDVTDLTPEGYWCDHVFHMPLIGIGAFNYYEYTLDLDFLKKCYKMIRACANFTVRHMVYRDGERYYIGKCTDLERLGASVENPFLTACGSIKLLECCHKAANILETDKDFADECRFIAEKLYESLPKENGRYVPFLGCKQKSIAVFGGKFPFDVLDKNDPEMISAMEDFEKNGAAFGNMYAVGQSISPWYACWKAIAYARMGLSDKAYGSLTQSYSSVGVFDEMFEINEKNVRKRPWFATASGIFVAAVNEMLLESDGKIIRILPAFPKNTDVSFSLCAKGGIVVEASVRNQKLEKVCVTKDGVDVTENFVIEF